MFLVESPQELKLLTANQKSMMDAICYAGDSIKLKQDAQFQTLMSVMEKIIEQNLDIVATQKAILDRLNATPTAP